MCKEKTILKLIKHVVFRVMFEKTSRTVPQFNIRVTYIHVYILFASFVVILILKVTKPKPVTFSWVVTIVGAGPAQTLLHVHVWYVKLTTVVMYTYKIDVSDLIDCWSVKLLETCWLLGWSLASMGGSLQLSPLLPHWRG